MDILIKNGLVYDPESGFKQKANIAVKGGKIAGITQEEPAAEKVIDADGLWVVPGFIDLHIHEDPMVESEEKGQYINFSTERAMLRMGVTTVVGGNCGFSPKDMKTYIEYLRKNGAPVNTMLLQGYNMIRGKFFADAEGQSLYRQGDVFASVTDEQIEQAKKEICESMDLGACGLSFGLEYTPGCQLEELVKVGSAIAGYENPILTVHYRYDADRCLESVEECIELSKRTGVPLEFSHIGSCSGYADIKYMDDSLRLLREARAAGVDIIADCYPYVAFSTLIGSTVFDDGWAEKWNVSYDAILPTEGKYKNIPCTEESFAYLRKNEPDSRVVCFAMRDENVSRAYEDETMIVASDGKFLNDQGHARTAGTFPRVLGLYSREMGILSFEEAIRKMTLLPAERMHLKTKGRLQPGMDADITVVNKETVIDGNTFTEPALPPTGIEYVVVGGKVSLEMGDIVSECNGVFIPRQGK